MPEAEFDAGEGIAERDKIATFACGHGKDTKRRTSTFLTTNCALRVCDYCELPNFGRLASGTTCTTVIGACSVKFNTVSDGSLICWLLVAAWTPPPTPAPAAAPMAAPLPPPASAPIMPPTTAPA